MSLPEIAQADMLADQFSTALSQFSPHSVAVIGCAGGNGFDRILPAVTKRIVGVDINPTYAASTASRFRAGIPGLEVHVADIQSGPLPFDPVELIYAALVFEYVSIQAALGNLSRVCRPGGRMVSVLQRPSARMQVVSPSPYRSLEALGSVMRLVSTEELNECAARSYFRLESKKMLVLESGKEFAVLVHRRA